MPDSYSRQNGVAGKIQKRIARFPLVQPNCPHHSKLILFNLLSHPLPACSRNKTDILLSQNHQRAAKNVFWKFGCISRRPGLLRRVCRIWRSLPLFVSYWFRVHTVGIVWFTLKEWSHPKIKLRQNHQEKWDKYYCYYNYDTNETSITNQWSCGVHDGLLIGIGVTINGWTVAVCVVWDLFLELPRCPQSPNPKPGSVRLYRSLQARPACVHECDANN